MFYKAYAEIRAEAARAYLGFAWWFLEPVLYMAVFYLIFETGLRQGGADFVPFLLCGLVTWKWFAGTLLGGANALSRNAAIIQQVYLPKIILPLVQVISNTAKFGVIFLLLVLCLMFVFGKSPAISWISLPLLMAVELLFIVGSTSLVAAIVPFAQDLRMLLDNLVIMLFFASGIFFDINNLTAEMRDILLLNPMSAIVANFRAVLLHGEWPSWGDLVQVSAISAGLLLPGVVMLFKYDRIYPKVLAK